jgi:hypothetical protein
LTQQSQADVVVTANAIGKITCGSNHSTTK